MLSVFKIAFKLVETGTVVDPALPHKTLWVTSSYKAASWRVCGYRRGSCCQQWTCLTKLRITETFPRFFAHYFLSLALSTRRVEGVVAPWRIAHLETIVLQTFCMTIEFNRSMSGRAWGSATAVPVWPDFYRTPKPGQDLSWKNSG